MLELLLDLARGPALCPPNEVADRDVRWNFDEHMDVVARQHTIDDGHPQLVANLLDDLAHPQADLAMQHLEPIFRRPDDMVAMVKSRVTTLAVAHSFYPRHSRRGNRRADVLKDSRGFYLT